jgi:hypothetical protein
VEDGTSINGTATPLPTFTPRARTGTPLATLALTKDSTILDQAPEPMESTAQPARQTLGMVLITLCGLGLIALIYSFLKK